MTVLDKDHVGHLADRLGRGLHSLSVEVLGVQRKLTRAQHGEPARFDVLSERVVLLPGTERARHLTRPEQVQLLLEADAALPRVDVERPAHLEIHRAERGHDGGANGQGPDGKRRIGNGGDEDLRARRGRHDHEEEENEEERQAMRQGHRQMIADL